MTSQLYVPFTELPAWRKWTLPCKREFRKGVAARTAGRELKHNPWKRSIGGRNYYAFEDAWSMGWKAADEVLNQPG